MTFSLVPRMSVLPVSGFLLRLHRNNRRLFHRSRKEFGLLSQLGVSFDVYFSRKVCTTMSVRTYNPSVLIGNWNEDICLQEVREMWEFDLFVHSLCDNIRELDGNIVFILEVSSKLIHLQDKLKDFLEKKESGELLIQKASNLLQNILKKVRMRNRIIS